MMNHNENILTEEQLDQIRSLDQRELFPYEILDQYAEHVAKKKIMPAELSALVQEKCQEIPWLQDDVDALVRGWEEELVIEAEEKRERLWAKAAAFAGILGAGSLGYGVFNRLNQPDIIPLGHQESSFSLYLMFGGLLVLILAGVCFVASRKTSGE